MPQKDLTHTPHDATRSVPHDAARSALHSAARTGLLDAVRESGIEADHIADAWAQLVAVQTEIALDAGGGAKATAAAKFVAGAAGLPLLVEPEARDYQLPMDEEVGLTIIDLVKRSEQGRKAAEARWGKGN